MVRRFLALVVLTLAAACGSAPQPKAPTAPLQAKVTSTPAVAVDPPEGPSEEASPVPVGKDDPTWGNRTALVTLVEMTDLQCPFCARAHERVKELEKKYGPDQLRIVWKHRPLPFHPNARPAAEWAQGIYALGGRDPFQCFVGKVFEHQAEMARASYETWVTECGASAQAVGAGVDTGRWVEKVDRDGAVADRLKASGTPTFFVNGALLLGAQPLEKFTALVDEHLELAKELLQKGAPREALYVAISTAVRKAEDEAAAKHHDEDDDDEKADAQLYKVPIGQSPQRGPAAAQVTVVVFSDFQCPYCKKVEETLAKVQEKYAGKVRFVWKDEPLPFHPRAEPAAQLAREARAQKGDAGFWKAHDALFEAQPKLEDEDLLAIAKRLGLDVGRVKEAIKGHKHKSAIDADADLADDLRANGTPHFFINGRRLSGAQPLPAFEKLIDAELTRAQAALGKGTPPAMLYEELIREGKGAPEPEKKQVAAAQKPPTRGNPRAKVVIQEFSDFQCPFCARVEDTVNEVMKNYGDRVQLQWRNLPLPMHPDASLAAQAAMEAYKQKGPAAFWKMHDKLYAAQQTPGGLKRDALEKYAAELGLDVAKLKAALDTESHKAELEADTKAANDAGIRGTPAFVINGYYLSGAQPYPKFKRLIERALAEGK